MESSLFLFDKKGDIFMDTIYIVLGHFTVDGKEQKDIYGAFSTIDLANECVETIKVELEYLEWCEIETVPVDAFGYK